MNHQEAVIQLLGEMFFLFPYFLRGSAQMTFEIDDITKGFHGRTQKVTAASCLSVYC